MKVTEFSNKTKVDNVRPEWEKYLGKEDFISYKPSYVGGTERDKFEKFTFPAEKTGDITYYLYNPTKNGAIRECGKYPLLVFIHGATNSFDGRICISHSGGEMFATADYQQKMGGGAFILVPLANEKKDENGELCDSWNEKYFPYLKDIINKTVNDNPISDIIIAGGSSGGYMTWGMVLNYPELFDGCIPVSSGFMPSISQLETLEKNVVNVLYACGRHDEFGCYKKEYSEIYDYISTMKNGICYTPEWTRNGDHGVASLFFGIEMGQHCMITQVQANLIYDDGAPYCDKIPNGITGWIKTCHRNKE